jgi:hypothetical protein
VTGVVIGHATIMKRFLERRAIAFHVLMHKGKRMKKDHVPVSVLSS